MMTFLIVITVFLLAVLGLGLGVAVGRRPLGGSCGNCSECLVRRAGS